MSRFVNLIADSILTELKNLHKATREHLSSVGGKFSWEQTSEENKEKEVGIRAVNDPAESIFEGLTEKLQTYSNIKLQHAAGVDQVRKNGDLSRKNKKIEIK